MIHAGEFLEEFVEFVELLGFVEFLTAFGIVRNVWIVERLDHPGEIGFILGRFTRPLHRPTRPRQGTGAGMDPRI